MKLTIVSIILSAGRSSRMNFPKALLEFQGKPFLKHVIHTHECAALPICVVLGYEHQRIEQSVDLSGVQVVVNSDPSRGQLSSLQLALDQASGSNAIIVHPVDHPLVQVATIHELANRFSQTQDRILIPEFEGKKGHPVLFPSPFYSDLKRAPLEEGARWVVRRRTESVLQVPVDDPGIVRNINTPDQFKDLQT